LINLFKFKWLQCSEVEQGDGIPIAFLSAGLKYKPRRKDRQ
jgi:hypothetical protein